MNDLNIAVHLNYIL